ncbi:hypothetical protein C8J56DRAFT_1039222 [Mycena floridula]|nr:hypothetical protein C8J56DRAFT_1039222 [Mycena floridula]
MTHKPMPFLGLFKVLSARIWVGSVLVMRGHPCLSRIKLLLGCMNEVGSGPDIDLWVFKAQLEQKFGFGNDAALARMQKKTQEYLIASLMKHKLASTQGHLADFSECTFIVDTMLTQDQFRND